MGAEFSGGGLLTARLKVGAMVFTRVFEGRTGRNYVVRFLGLIAVLGAMFYSQTASAGPYADDLAKCFVKSSTTNDKIIFSQWMFAELALHPSIRSMSSVTDEQRKGLTKSSSDYYQRLLFQDCRQQTIDALKYEGATAIIYGSQILGQVAMRDMMSNPETRAGLADLTKTLDKQKMADLLKDAGLPVPASLTQPAK